MTHNQARDIIIVCVFNRVTPRFKFCIT
jgi:hypothetical protein